MAISGGVYMVNIGYGGWAALMDTIWRGRGMVAVDIVGVVW